MITLKDIIDLRPYCKVCIHNSLGYDFVDIYKHPEKYVISDMKAVSSVLDVLIAPQDGFQTKFDKYGNESAGLGIEKLFTESDIED